MNSKPKYLSVILHQSGAVFLLLIFLSTFLISALHHHQDYSSPTDKHQREQVKTFYAPCKTCDLMKHQSTDLNYTAPLAFPFTTPPLQNRRTFLTPQLRSSFILKCSNKGPPVLHS